MEKHVDSVLFFSKHSKYHIRINCRFVEINVKENSLIHIDVNNKKLDKETLLTTTIQQHPYPQKKDLCRQPCGNHSISITSKSL